MYHQKPLIGVKGHITSRDIELESKTHRTITEVIAEKVTFLSNKRYCSDDRIIARVYELV